MQKLKFPEEYIEHGEFVLHSGQSSNIKYDVEELMKTDNFYHLYLIECIPFSLHYIGIDKGGKDMAKAVHLEAPWSKFSYITKEGKLAGDKPDGEWMLIDDVVTTGKSLLEAIAIVGSQPEEIIVAVDRRERNENPRVKSIFECPLLAA